ncbi:hypothetical protein DWW39_10115 [Clostridium sp. AF15-31]|nr:hypothetical protein DWW39_10115 [Clostridium sp. AF15-31]
MPLQKCGGFVIYSEFNRGADGARHQLLEYKRKELVLMITFSDLNEYVIMLCAVITLVIYISRKK